MSYQVIEDLNRLNFILRVNKEIARGWKLLGGVAYGLDGGYAQAITFESKTIPESARPIDDLPTAIYKWLDSCRDYLPENEQINLTILLGPRL